MINPELRHPVAYPGFNFGCVPGVWGVWNTSQGKRGSWNIFLNGLYLEAFLTTLKLLNQICYILNNEEAI